MSNSVVPGETVKNTTP